jgi:hypothetical protein
MTVLPGARKRNWLAGSKFMLRVEVDIYARRVNVE